jgi:UDPglucose 6-dehydrogenase
MPGQGRPALQFDIVSNPEFLKEGSAVSDCRRPDRIIIGCERDEVRDVMRDLYAPFNRNHDRIMFMDLRSAELTKYAANCMLATKISFINQIAELAEHLGADIESVRLGIGADSRIGYHFIYPGCGYGGSCFQRHARADSQRRRGQLLQRPVASGGSHQRAAETKLFERINAFYKGDLKRQDLCLGAWRSNPTPTTCVMRRAACWNPVGRRRQCACVRPRSDAGNPTLYPMKRS